MGPHWSGAGKPLGIVGAWLSRSKNQKGEQHMAYTWQKIKVYTKLSFICVVMLAALVFIVSNGTPVTISFGFWTLVEGIGAWLLIVLAGVAGIVVFLVVGRTSSLLRDFKRLRSDNNKRNQNSQSAGPAIGQ